VANKDIAYDELFDFILDDEDLEALYASGWGTVDVQTAVNGRKAAEDGWGARDICEDDDWLGEI
jgi:hypothetical protein